MRKIKTGTHKPPSRTQRARMYALQNAMPHFVHFGHPLRRRGPPRQKHNPIRPLLRHNIDHLLRELLPAVISMTVRLVRPHRQTRVQEQYATVCPGGEQASVLGRRFEALGVFFLEELVDIYEGWRRRGGRADREAEAVGLVGAVVGVLA